MVDEDPTKELVSNLSPESQYLETLDSYFNSLQYTRKFHVMSFYETKTTNTIIRDIDGKWNRSGPRVIMVSRASATQICSRAPGEVRSIDEDHSAMVKFGPGDIHYTGVLDGLRKLLDRKTSSEYAELARKAASKRSATHETQTVNDNVEPSMPYEWPNLVAKQAKNHSSDDILNSLWLDVFDHRLKDISPHFQSTFEWIFNDESLGFVPWLLHGDGAYWVEGKPGAGKSTLLKFVYESQKTMELLENWNQPGTFIPAGFFFHHRGSRFQKFFEGMLRNLLYQVIKKVPSLYRDIPKSCLLAISENFNSTWNLGYLREALFSILRQRHTALKICVFIDALDELDGHLELISEFMTNLVDQKPGSAVCFIFTQADGVFLWVKLAIEDITKALIQHDIQSINELEALLQKVPPGLDEFYESIIERIPADFKWEAYLTLEVILRAEETIRLGDIFNIVRCFGCKTSLQDNCGGLIELDFNADRIHLMHETVRAFMSRPGFEHLFFRQPILFRAQNGYTELAKFMLTKTQHYDARELDDPVL
ncbi:Small s protein [Lasiodiplodia theobromae]|uniref:Small s protein n=1 Tax=Lasiodiplodia theobromae TaxID=45133 RepID=UPI0015C3F5EC|nr:Small s protein [Lasiodiplodia theobromae]KAF4541095.1 Small s protein [Lasiodiplodia theobromae]